MSESDPAAEITAGAAVVGRDGDTIGRVAAVHRDVLVVETGAVFTKSYYIPLEAVATIDDGTITLTVDKDVAMHSGWDTMPGAATKTTPEPEADADENDRSNSAAVAR
jgi:hypothetical protein